MNPLKRNAKSKVCMRTCAHACTSVHLFGGKKEPVVLFKRAMLSRQLPCLPSLTRAPGLSRLTRTSPSPTQAAVLGSPGLSLLVMLGVAELFVGTLWNYMWRARDN